MRLRPRPQAMRALTLAALALCAGLVTTRVLSSAQAADNAAPKGFLYRVAPAAGMQGHALYLYGTLHIGRSTAVGLDPATINYVAQCQHLALELDPHNVEGIRRALQTYAVYPADDQLSAHVPAALNQHALAVAGVVKFPDKNAEQLHPWMLANILSQLTLFRAGFDPRHGSEVLLTEEAQKDHLDVSEVEGPDVQYRILGGAPDDVQIDALSRTLDLIDNGVIAEQAGTLLTAWEKSDVPAIEELLRNLHTEAGLYPHYMATELLEARNASMADVAVRDMNQPGTTFFAVGALHLFGQNGLIGELKKRGYTVTQLSAAAPG